MHLSQPHLSLDAKRLSPAVKATSPWTAPSPTLKSAAIQPQFQGNVTETVIRDFTKQLSPLKRLGTNWLAFSSKYGAAGLALQGFLAVWTPKALVSRSWAELFETTYLEAIEHFLFYFSAGVFGHLLVKALPQRRRIEEQAAKLGQKMKAHHLLGHSVDELRALKNTGHLTEPLLRKINVGKAGVLLGAVGALTLGMEYALTFARNLFTEKLFKVNKFSDVVNLTKGRIENGQKSDYWHKAIKVMKIAGLTSLGLLGLGAVIARHGDKIKSARFHQGIEKLNKLLDFNFKRELNADKSIKKIRYGLSKAQLNFVIWTGVISYLHATRTKLEFWEVLSRLAIVAPYLASQGNIFQWGGQWLLGKAKGKAWGPFQRAIDSEAIKYTGKGWVKRETISIENAIEKAVNQANGNLAQAAKQPVFTDALKLHLVPFLAGITTVGFGVSILNRLWTAIRFKNAEKRARQHTQIPYAAPSTDLYVGLAGQKSFKQFVNRIGLQRFAAQQRHIAAASALYFAQQPLAQQPTTTTTRQFVG